MKLEKHMQSIKELTDLCIHGNLTDEQIKEVKYQISILLGIINSIESN